MTDQAGPAYDDAAVMTAAGMFALNMSLPPARKFKAIDGDRRRFGDRKPGCANLTSIQGGKDQQCQ